MYQVAIMTKSSQKRLGPRGFYSYSSDGNKEVNRKYNREELRKIDSGWTVRRDISAGWKPIEKFFKPQIYRYKDLS